MADALIKKAIEDEAEPEFVAEVMVLLSRTFDWASSDVARCINSACPGHLDIAAFNEPLKQVLSAKGFIRTIRARPGLSRLAAARAYVALRAVVKVKAPARLKAIAAGWSFKEKCKLVELLVEDAVDSVKSAARFVARAAEAFDWKKKKRRRLMQAVVDSECFEGLYGAPCDVLEVMPDIKAKLILPEGGGVDEEEPDSEDLEFINDGDLDFSDDQESDNGSSSSGSESEQQESEEEQPVKPIARKRLRRKLMSESDDGSNEVSEEEAPAPAGKSRKRTK